MSKIYVVMGSTGEYSDREEWIVCAYADEEMAKHHAETATAEARRIQNTTKRYCHVPDDQAKAWDPHMSIDYTGADYTVCEVEIRTELPKVES
jgi:roadblock/LC7 domain-containing protein